MRFIVFVLISLLVATSANAHEGHGHGLEGIWHYLATPEHVAYLVLVVLALVLAIRFVKRLCMRR